MAGGWKEFRDVVTLTSVPSDLVKAELYFPAVTQTRVGGSATGLGLPRRKTTTSLHSYSRNLLYCMPFAWSRLLGLIVLLSIAPTLYLYLYDECFFAYAPATECVKSLYAVLAVRCAESDHGKIVKIHAVILSFISTSLSSSKEVEIVALQSRKSVGTRFGCGYYENLSQYILLAKTAPLPCQMEFSDQTFPYESRQVLSEW